jgi:demethylmenaquinone methyltransferase/2-methoxy-6-polyprenyl-1,4-benzoquinol methylase
MSAPTPSPAAATAPKPADAPAWTAPELANPHGQAQKPDKVRRMFAAIAGSYDLNNRVHSFWRDQAWRRFAVRRAAVKPTDEVLDVACGTGDLTRLFAAAGARRVVGLDFTAEMLAVAERKRQAALSASASSLTAPAGPAVTTYIEGDAQALPFPDASFDVLSIAFGIRNVADPTKALAQFRRVLRPDGRLIILEFDKVRIPVLGWCADFYTRRVMPLTATLISGDKSGAYRYLPASVATFATREELAQLVTAAGFINVEQTPLSLGVCVCTLGRVP